jgi:hypothetical protein
LGGPLRADRAWFFAPYFYLHRNSQISRIPSQLNNLRASIPGWQPFDNRGRHGTGFIKVNAQVGSRHQLHGFFLKPRGFEESNASTDSRRYNPSGTTGNGVAGGPRAGVIYALTADSKNVVHTSRAHRPGVAAV